MEVDGNKNEKKKTLKKLEEETPFFSRSYIVSRINYNLLSAKTLFAITTTIVHAKQVFAGGKLYFLLASSPHKQKNTEIYPLHSYTFPPENQLLHSLKRVLLPPHPPLPLPFPLSFSLHLSFQTPKIPHFTRL